MEIQAGVNITLVRVAVDAATGRVKLLGGEMELFRSLDRDFIDACERKYLHIGGTDDGRFVFSAQT
jgi:hypothetical protein